MKAPNMWHLSVRGAERKPTQAAEEASGRLEDRKVSSRKFQVGGKHHHEAKREK